MKYSHYWFELLFVKIWNFIMIMWSQYLLSFCKRRFNMLSTAMYGPLFWKCKWSLYVTIKAKSPIYNKIMESKWGLWLRGNILEHHARKSTNYCWLPLGMKWLAWCSHAKLLISSMIRYLSGLCKCTCSNRNHKHNNHKDPPRILKIF